MLYVFILDDEKEVETTENRSIVKRYFERTVLKFDKEQEGIYFQSLALVDFDE